MIYQFLFRLLWMVVAAAWLAFPAFAQDGKAARPKIGLALAGGGALGLAHVGVLLWMDEHHIPIDYIAGTSMGGLVGGAYATGMSPQEIRALLDSLNWDETLRSTPPYESLTFRRREDRRDFPNELELGWRGGLALPSGLNPGHQIGLALSRICLPYPELTSFDDLPTPFRCMATDMEHGTAVELKSGSLETALRATIAIPGYFNPVSRDQQLLADGGLLNNLPTEAAKGMGADIVIAVDLQGALSTQAQLQSLVALLGQTVAIALLDNMRRSLEKADIALAPTLDSLGSFDYARVEDFVKRGYDAAQQKSALLSRLALSETEWQDYLARRAARRRLPALTPEFIQITGVSGAQADDLAGRLRPLEHQPLDPAHLEKLLTDITGAGRYASLSYERAEEGGRTGLRIRAVPKAYGPPLLNLGLAINGAERDNIQTTFGARLTSLGARGDEVRTDLRLGSDIELASEFYHPSRNFRTFIAPRLFAQDLDQNLYDGGNRLLTAKRSQVGGALDIGYNPDRRSQIRLGAGYSRFGETIRTGGASEPDFQGHLFVPSLRYAYDGLDSALGPHRGAQIDFALNDYEKAPGAPGRFETAELRVRRFVPLGRKGTAFADLSGGTAFGGVVPTPQKFLLGGPLRLGAYGLNEFQGDRYFLVSGGCLYRLLEVPAPFSTRILLGGWYEYGSIADRASAALTRQDASVGTLLETPLGPVIVGYSYGERNRQNLYFAVGTLF